MWHIPFAQQCLYSTGTRERDYTNVNLRFIISIRLIVVIESMRVVSLNNQLKERRLTLVLVRYFTFFYHYLWNEQE
jgi:hypothetical protein